MSLSVESLSLLDALTAESITKVKISSIVGFNLGVNIKGYESN